MSPTVITQQEQKRQTGQPKNFHSSNIKEQFTHQRIIVSQQENKTILQEFHTLLSKYPQWYNRTSLVFLSNGSQENNLSSKNVYYFDKETYDVVSTIAAVEIIKSSGDNQLVFQDKTTMAQQEVDLNTMNDNAIAELLNASLFTQPLNTSILVNAYNNTKQRLFLFDYDGTLTPIVSNPADAQPTPTLLQYLNTLCKDPCNTVWIISGRDQDFLDTHLGKIPRLGLSAEHGSFMKQAGLNDWIDMLKDADMSWKNVALSIFEKYTKCNPGTVIEQKKSSITWHYRNAANTEEAEKQSHLCHRELMNIPGVDILVGKMNLEVRSLLVNKGEVVKRIKQSQPSDLIMCAGDDSTDEDMFRALLHDKQAFTVSVGPLSKKTSAKYCVEHSEDVVNILGQLVNHTSAL